MERKTSHMHDIKKYKSIKPEETVERDASFTKTSPFTRLDYDTTQTYMISVLSRNI